MQTAHAVEGGTGERSRAVRQGLLQGTHELLFEGSETTDLPSSLQTPTLMSELRTVNSNSL